MKSAPRTAALLTGAMLVLVGPIAGFTLLRDPADPRISVGAAPAATLVPGDVRDRTGRMIAGAVWTGLVAYDAATGVPADAAAESVTSPDRRVWTVRLRPGGRFHDGSPVTARSFTGAWTSVLNENWHGAPLLTDVAGIKGAARAVGRSAGVAGLKVEDDRTFEVTLDRPLNGFRALLGDPAFLPMPESVLRSRDWASYGRLPIGNGPYRVRSHDASGTVLRRPAGGREIVVEAIPDAARQYAAVEAGDLDLATQVPPGRHASMDTDFRGRHLALPGRTTTYLVFPERAEHLSSPALRQAMSMAIDRSAVTEGPLGHQASPANALVPPGVLPGRREGQCRLCVHDSKAATAALADAGGPTGPVTIRYEAGDAAGVTAVAGQLRKELKLDVRTRPAEPAELRGADGPFVLHTTAAYPAPVAALAPLRELADGYASDLIDEAERAATPEEAVTPARLAETALLRDMPAMPLWSSHEHLVWSERLRGVRAEPFTGLHLDRLALKE
ncbi:peptide ABC transporter substrate-binding protein [Spirillospora sp. NBC_01491]|uniref:peptide ABC transporter substrate-binding protein n=1 Tax=Spirillospora sp. NBC_01491 TaxID=2976007 RepID=UPI002E35B8AA|nr:ABC transporter substrate-binding protein [Spirillospora sp. NBC_01491]